MQHQHQARTPEMEQCILNCERCYRQCLEMLDYCLSMGGSHAEVKHIQLLIDCAKVCETSVHMMARYSAFHPQMCGVCADVCAACAQSCEQVDPDDAMHQACVEACRDCEASCRAMAMMAA